MPRREVPPLPTLTKDAGPAAIWNALGASGAVCLRDAATSPAEFEAITADFGSNFQVHQDPTRRRFSADDTTQGVTGGADAIALHAERSYLPGRPELLFFCCLTPPASGGATTWCDGAAIVDALTPEQTRLLEHMSLLWRTTQDAPMWQRVWETTDQEEAGRAIDRMLDRVGEQTQTRHWFEVDVLHVEYRTACLTSGPIGGRKAFATYLLLQEDDPGGPQATQADGDPVPVDLLGQVGAVAADLTVDIEWRRGDVVMIDNTRCMHGRRAFTGGEREILVRMGDVHARFATA